MSNCSRSLESRSKADTTATRPSWSKAHSPIKSRPARSGAVTTSPVWPTNLSEGTCLGPCGFGSDQPGTPPFRFSQLWIGDSLKSVVYLPFEQSNGKADVGGVGGKETPMDRIHQDEQTGEQFLLDLDEIARVGARRMLAEALEAEVEAYLEAAIEEREERGRALVVRNGHPRESAKWFAQPGLCRGSRPEGQRWQG